MIRASGRFLRARYENFGSVKCGKFLIWGILRFSRTLLHGVGVVLFRFVSLEKQFFSLIYVIHTTVYYLYINIYNPTTVCMLHTVQSSLLVVHWKPWWMNVWVNEWVNNWTNKWKSSWTHKSWIKRNFYFILVSRNIKFWKIVVLQITHRHSLVATVAIGKPVSVLPE